MIETLRDPHDALRFMQFAVDNLPDAAYVVREDASILYANAAATQMLGYTREEFLRMHVYDLNVGVHPEWPVIWDMLRKARKRTFEVAHRTKGGVVVPVEICANLIVFEGGEYSCSFARDITERKHLEERLLQSEKMRAIGQLAGGVAHDFNNQLTGVSGYADLVLEKVKGDTEAEEFLEQIHLAVKRSAGLTEQLLTFSRQDNALSEVVDVHAVAAEAIGILQHSIDKRIIISRKFFAKISAVVGDPSRLQSAILNLALNARDAMAGGGQLAISSENVVLEPAFCLRQSPPIEPGPYLLLTVADDGAGITPEVLKRIFEPFFTTKERGRGTGLGLAAVYGTVKSHRGTLSVTSEVGVGTVVRMYLPCHATLGESDQPAPALTPLGRKVRVMVVEDENALRNVAELILKGLGCEVSAFKNGAEAVEFYAGASARIDVIMLDLCMPVMDGKETFFALRQINPNAKVLLASGYSLAGSAQTLLEEGAIGFIQKPYRKAALVQKLNDVLR